jgi:TusE/DsrC/DsvC family sulfur relay protein
MNALAQAFEAVETVYPVHGILFDEDGFFLDPETWNERAAELVAEQDGIGPLQSAHWAVINFVRDRYLRLGAIPPMRRICRSSALQRHQVKALFGSCREVWRLAGLPKPGEEAKAYML